MNVLGNIYSRELKFPGTFVPGSKSSPRSENTGEPLLLSHLAATAEVICILTGLNSWLLTPSPSVAISPKF